MIASILKLSRSDFQAMQNTSPSKIINVYSIHKMVYSLFPRIDNETRDFLFADKGGNFNERHILILSKRPPQVPEHGRIESKRIPEFFLAFDAYCFEVRLNPVKRDKNSGKLIPVKKQEPLLEWFCSKSEQWGFETDLNSLHIQRTDVQIFDKQDKQVTQNAATFIGKLKVRDRSLFINSFEQGMGRGKSFGFGLLQLVPIRA
ncbi:MAG: type I-E CRISPR-associated protein Cas6/Cse3/CasE [Treponema sp.]|jgi:CRISPR system Cascade subunit CasE|nr:type I-E CRISPR-associated protein Cas6/Cse3/CasE [Treponema sp.]